MLAREYLEKGRHLAERIPYSLVALAARIAVADIFWRSGQTKVNGLSIREETFYLFREEYKVPLLPPDLAAYLSTTGENGLPLADQVMGAPSWPKVLRDPALKVLRGMPGAAAQALSQKYSQ